MEPENHELKVNEMIWHLSERYLNDDSESDSDSPRETLERKRDSIKS